jgi:hypothetical protein
MRRLAFVIGIWLGFATALGAQTSPQPVPRLIPFSGQVTDAAGEPATGLATLNFAIYEEQTGGAPVWVEIQTVELDAQGKYSVLLGSTTDGLPQDLFATNAARWLGVQMQGQDEQPRVQFVAVPYALKAAEADTLAGKATTDFVLAENLTESVKAVLSAEGVGGRPPAGDGPIALVASANALVKYTDGAGTMDSSAVREVGGNVGIGTAGPVARLHVKHPSVNVIGIGNLVANSTFFEGSNATGASWGIAVAYDNWGGYSLFQGVDRGSTTAHSLLLNPYGGSIGVGTIFPRARLHVQHPNVNVTGIGNLVVNSTFFEGSNSGGASWGLAVAYDNWGGYPFIQGVDRADTTARGLLLNPYGGNVGIGTRNPAAKLHVAGDVVVDGNIGAKYQDVAEWVDAAGELSAGTVVVIDETAPNRVRAADRAYDSAVAGAVSPQPGVVLGEAGPGKALVAQSGRVRIKVDATYGAIKAGDLLVTSPTPGHGMRSEPVRMGDTAFHRPGTILGKALEPLAGGRGEILVLITLQ